MQSATARPWHLPSTTKVFALFEAVQSADLVISGVDSDDDTALQRQGGGNDSSAPDEFCRRWQGGKYALRQVQRAWERAEQEKPTPDKAQDSTVCDIDIAAQWVCSNCARANWDIKWACRVCLKPRGPRDWYYPARRTTRKAEEPRRGTDSRTCEDKR